MLTGQRRKTTNYWLSCKLPCGQLVLNPTGLSSVEPASLGYPTQGASSWIIYLPPHQMRISQKDTHCPVLSTTTRTVGVGSGGQRKPFHKEMQVLAVRKHQNDHASRIMAPSPPATASATVVTSSWPPSFLIIREIYCRFPIHWSVNSQQIFLKQDRYYLPSGAFSSMSNCSNSYIYYRC